ncbi:MAG TPA: RIP metalloprotease RseP [Deltaproteobacteria bacterium]|nr:MAG: RIP metalloprotease RseP [Deltaproteobacteria bacterium GWA2_45_12]HBF11784.1 RIP metalloprotease RseP [Deltaproteobacteria bacterium]
MTIIYFIVALGILVVVHEWGHFIMARRAGIRVDQFSIGFGPKLFSYKSKQTEYLFSLLPFGGFVRIHGQDPDEESEGDPKKAEAIRKSPDAYASKTVLQRLGVVLGGPVMNLVFCVLIMPVVFMLGKTVPAILEKPPVILGVKENSPGEKAGFKKGDLILEIDGKKFSEWDSVFQWVLLHPQEKAQVLVERQGQNFSLLLETTTSPYMKETVGYAGFEPLFFVNNEPVLGMVSANGPAFQAGLKEKDQIQAIDNKPINSWEELTAIIRSSEGKKMLVDYMREGQALKAEITPQYHEGMKAWVIGITKYFDPSSVVKKRYGFFEAFKEGTQENLKLLGMTYDVLKRLFSFQLSYKALGGPIQIAQASAAAGRQGLSDFLYFLSFLSMQLGILNLLPIPVVDGGHVLFLGIEVLRGKPLSYRIRHAAAILGMVFLVGLMLVVTANDIDRVWGLTQIWEWVRGVLR